MTARDDILKAARSLEAHGIVPWTPQQCVTEARRSGSKYAESTLRTHIVSWLCVDAPANHGTRWPDLERVDRHQHQLRTDG